ncbi:MAG: helicase HerA-like domain-containing protein [Kofleriaceae bacterium]
MKSGGLFIAGSKIPPLPLDFITESSAILAKKGAGKTNAALVLLEEAFEAGAPVVSIDPKGDHWGVRAAGTGAGLPIPVFGGLHGDIPLEPGAGAYIAELVRSKRLSVVLDVSEFTAGERAKFLTAFADRLYRFDAREPMLLVLEEAHEYIPQFVRGEDARMVGAFERLVKLGRSKGIGVVMVTQRSASLNKNVLTQADNLFVMRTTSPQDRAAVKAWLDTNADAASIIAELPSLQTGESWLVSPVRGEPVKFRWRMRHTYDAGYTPKLGDAPRPPATLADVDLGEISAAMSETIERAKADDPAELRRQLREALGAAEQLRRELDLVPTETVVTEVAPPWLADELRAVQDDVLAAHKRVSELATRVGGLTVATALGTHPVIAKHVNAPATLPPLQQPAKVQIPPKRATSAEPPRAPAVGDDELRLTGTHRSVLGVLAQFPQPLTIKQLAIRAGSSAKSSTYTGALATLKREGLIVGDAKGMTITDAGRQLAGPVAPMPTGRELLEWWRGKLKPTEHRLLEVLVGVHPSGLDQLTLAAEAGNSPTSSTFTGAVAALRSQELITGDRDAWYAADVFAR